MGTDNLESQLKANGRAGGGGGRKWWLQLILAALGLLLAAAVFRRVSWARFTEVVRGVKWGWFALFVLVSFLSINLRTLLWRLYLSGLDIKVGYRRLLLANLASRFTNQLGSNYSSIISKPLLLRQLQPEFPLNEGVSTIVVEQIMTISSYVLALLAGLGYFAIVGGRAHLGTTSLILLFYVAVFAALFILYLASESIVKLAEKALALLPSQPLRDKLSRKLRQQRAEMTGNVGRILRHRRVAGLGLLGQFAVVAGVTGLMWFCLFQAVNQPPTPLWIVFLLAPLVWSGTIVPFLPGGLGVVEGLALYYFVGFGISAEGILALLILLRGVNKGFFALIVGSICTYVCCHGREPIP